MGFIYTLETNSSDSVCTVLSSKTTSFTSETTDLYLRVTYSMCPFTLLGRLCQEGVCRRGASKCFDSGIPMPSPLAAASVVPLIGRRTIPPPAQPATGASSMQITRCQAVAQLA